MATAADEASIEDARNTILQADLTPIEHKMLVFFIDEADSPGRAACEVLRRIQSSADRPVEDVLRGLKKDWRRLVATIARSEPDPTPDPSSLELLWKRDQSRCVFTRPAFTRPGSQEHVQHMSPVPTFIMPPSIVHLLQDEASPSRSLMDAFVGPSGTARLLRLLSDTSARGILANSWLVSPEASRVFQQGHVQILPKATLWKEYDCKTVDEEGASKAVYCARPLYPEPYEAPVPLTNGSDLFNVRYITNFVVQTEDAKQLPLPDPFLLKVHCRMVNAHHQFYVEASIARGWPPQEPEPILSRILRFVIRHLCPILPTAIRTLFWRRLFEAGKARYPYGISAVVQRLPLGLYAKSCGRTQYNEPKALQLLERHAPSIPAPRLVDSFQMAPSYGLKDGFGDWFVMTGVPGVRVESVLYRMSYAERHRLADDIRAAIDRMHKIPNTTPYCFASVLGGPIHDARLGGGLDGCGPYNSEEELNAQLAKGVESYLRQEVPTAFSRTHESVFTHGDFYLSNVLVSDGVFSGLVDWEGAGFMPTYWDFIKAMRSSSVRWEDIQALYRRIWGHEFDVELEAERWLWMRFPFGGPE